MSGNKTKVLKHGQWIVMQIIMQHFIHTSHLWKQAGHVSKPYAWILQCGISYSPPFSEVWTKQMNWWSWAPYCSFFIMYGKPHYQKILSRYMSRKQLLETLYLLQQCNLYWTTQQLQSLPSVQPFNSVAQNILHKYHQYISTNENQTGPLYFKNSHTHLPNLYVHMQPWSSTTDRSFQNKNCFVLA
jgi:hypothetical protein